MRRRWKLSASTDSSVGAVAGVRGELGVKSTKLPVYRVELHQERFY
jgi:hypothetical protein